MNKSFDKILERLQEERELSYADFSRYVEEVSPCLDAEYDDFFHRGLERASRLVKEVAEEYKGGWIPCSERLPEDDKKQYIVQKTIGFIDILGFTKDAYKLDRYDFAEYKGKKKQLFYDYDSEYGYTEWECEAWQPLPEPLKESEEE